MTARFWVYLGDSPVRLAVTANRPLTFDVGGRTDEGYHWETHEYQLIGDTLIRRMGYDSRDCDGRYSGSSEAACRVDRLDAHRVEGDSLTYPAWENGDELHRDHTAEAAGY